jgi:ADP-ribose pyrophosphatase
MKVWRDDVQLSNGKESFREYIKHPGAACIVPVLPNGNFLMVHQYRHACKRVFLEFPAGKRDPEEDSFKTAHRELQEECGFISGKMTFMTKIFNCIGYADEFIDLYIAEDLSATSRNLDVDEMLDLIEVSPAELQEKIWNGEVEDVKTQIAGIWALKRLKLI